MADNNNGSVRLTNWLLGILAVAMFAAIGQLWVMSQGVSKMSGTMDEWRTVLDKVEGRVTTIERGLNEHERLPEHGGAGRRLDSLEERLRDMEREPPGAGR